MRARCAPTLEGLDDGHATTAAWTRMRERERFNGIIGICITDWTLPNRRIEQLPHSREVCGTSASGEEAVVADTMEAARQDVDEETADELIDRECHDLVPFAAVSAVVLPFEGHAVIID